MNRLFLLVSSGTLCCALACSSGGGTSDGGPTVAGTGAGAGTGAMPGTGGDTTTPGSGGTAGSIINKDPTAPVDLGPTDVAQGFVGMVTGTIDDTNNLWGPGDVTLTGPVSIPPGQTLTLNPGTHVFGEGVISADGGRFVCNGSFADPATIFQTSIALNGESHQMRFCTMNSVGDTAIDVADATLDVEHFQLQNFGTKGIHVHGPLAKVSVNFSTLGSKGNLFTQDDTTQTGVAVLIAADAANGGSTISNSVLGFLQNATNIGLRIEAAASNVAVSYSMLSGTEPMPALGSAVEVHYGFPDVTDIPNLDYRLNFYSPALDLADPVANYELEPGPNGGRANLGYYGRTPGARITSVELTNPNGCKSYTPGEILSVAWKSSPNTGPKTLEFSSDGGTTWETVANVVNDTGKTNFTVPDVTTTQGLLRFSQDNDPANINDTSNRVFSINAEPDEEACALEIRCPNGTEGCKPFNVICYTGYREGQMPTGQSYSEPTYEQVLEDMQIMAPLTHGIRTYGSGLNLHNGQHVPGIADMLGLDLHMGVWLDDSYTDEINMQAIDDALSIIADGHPSIKTLIVGNEYMLRVRQNFGDTPAAEARLAGYIRYAREQAPSNIAVVTGESYVDWLEASAELFEAVDYVVWHVHPWWQQHNISTAATHVENAHNEMLAKMASVGIDKPELLGETGYPWAIPNGAALGSEANQAQYLHDVHEYSLRSGLEYWFFSGFDEPWKTPEGPVGDKWGMWDVDRMPHQIISTIDTLITPEGLWPPPAP